MRTVFEQLAQDLRYGVRGLRRSRAFLMTTVLTLAVGVGLLAVAFTVVNAYVLRPYAVRDPQQLHQVGWRSRDGGGQSFRWREYEELRDRTDLFESAVAESTRFISSNGRPLAAALVSDNYFESLGPAVFMGRAWRADERGVEGVVLSHQGWMRLFANDSVTTIPRELDINGRLFPVIGDPAPGVHRPERFPARCLDPVHHLRRPRQSRFARRRSAAGRRGPGAPEAGDDRGAGTGRVDPVHGPRCAAYRRRSRRRHPARDAEPAVGADGGCARAGVRGLRSRARRRLRERVQRDAGARRVAASRDCRAPVARCQPRAARAAVADRRPVDRDAGRRRGPDARRVAAARRHGGVLEHAAAVDRCAGAPGAGRHRLSRIRVLPGGVRGCTADVCAAAGAAGVAADADGRAARPRRRRPGRLAAPEPAGRQPGRDRDGPGDPGGDPGAQRRGDRRHRPRLPTRRACFRSTSGERTRRQPAGWRRSCAPIPAWPKSPSSQAIRCSSARAISRRRRQNSGRCTARAIPS